MIMRPGQQLLLPANPVFIWTSLVVALMLNMFMNIGPFGRAAWVPDLLAVVLVFWSVHQPLRIGVGVAFVFGLFMDVHQGSLLGQHALSYSVLSFLSITMHRRLIFFDVFNQAVQILPLFVVSQLLELLVRFLAGDGFPGWVSMLSPVLESVIWPVASLMLLAPQRRAPDPDNDRPL